MKKKYELTVIIVADAQIRESDIVRLTDAVLRNLSPVATAFIREIKESPPKPR